MRDTSSLRALVIVGLLLLPGSALAAEAKGTEHAEAAPVPGAELVAPVIPKQVYPTVPPDDYCANISNLAADARYALQKKTLEDLQKQIDQKLTLLEATRAENQAFLKMKDDAAKDSQKGLVDIFAKMKPDVAAAQFEILDVATSASILKQLNARVASTILNEMKAPIAAAITIKMAEPVGELKTGDGT
jgi:flagellar motility protein MotE (MotC chaperone)